MFVPCRHALSLLSLCALLSLRSYVQYKQSNDLREIKVMRRYHIQDREDYHKSVPADTSSKRWTTTDKLVSI